MRVLFWLLGLLAAAAGLAIAARYNEGYVLLVLPPWRVELSFNLLVFLLALAFLGGWIAIHLLYTAIHLPSTVAEFRAGKKRERGATLLRDALRLLWEGRFGHARKAAEEAHQLGETPGLAALIAARAAHAVRDVDATRRWLAVAGEHGSELSTARWMTGAELALERRSTADALEALQQLGKGKGRHIAAMRIALRAHQAAGDWPEMLKLVRALEKHGALTADQAAPLKRHAHREAIHALSGDPVRLAGYCKDLPAAEGRDATLVAQAARGLIAGGDCGAAADLIEAQLAHEWDGDLAGLYGECVGGDVVARIAKAEEWLKVHPQESGLLLALGRLCEHQQLWGKAQSYLEASLGVQPGRAAHLALARLLDGLERPEEANRHYREAAKLAD